MRRLNLFLVIGIFVTFLGHAIGGALRLTGAENEPASWLARACVFFVCLHMIVTTILTVRTLRARRLSGAGYFKENRIFWIRRISGFAVLIPLVMHLLIFTPGSGDAYRLAVFTTGRLISQILLVLTVALHALSNIRPLLISLGVRDTKSFRTDLLLVLSVLLLLFGAAFFIYYLRWMAV